MKRMSSRVWVLAVAAASISVSGCATVARQLGFSNSAPDEFRVVTKAPLTIPPDYNIRPPAPGEVNPDAVSPGRAARVAGFGEQVGQAASEGEKLFVRRAGAAAVDPGIRALLDREEGDIARKNASFSNRVLNFGLPVAVAPTEPQVDPAGEAARLQREKELVENATGGKEVKITRNRGAGFKLPGL